MLSGNSLFGGSCNSVAKLTNQQRESPNSGEPHTLPSHAAKARNDDGRTRWKREDHVHDGASCPRPLVRHSTEHVRPLSDLNLLVCCVCTGRGRLLRRRHRLRRVRLGHPQAWCVALSSLLVLLRYRTLTSMLLYIFPLRIGDKLPKLSNQLKHLGTRSVR